MKFLTWFVLALVCLTVLVVCMQDGKIKPCGDRIGATAAAHTGISKLLKSPSTADFESGPTVSQTNCTDWVVKSWVDSQNSFGAVVRTHFIAYVVYDPKDGLWRMTPESKLLQ